MIGQQRFNRTSIVPQHVILKYTFTQRVLEDSWYYNFFRETSGFILDNMRATYFERNTEEPFYLLFLSEVNYLIRMNPITLVQLTFIGIE